MAGVGKALRGFGKAYKVKRQKLVVGGIVRKIAQAAKSKSDSMLKVKPLSERKKFGEKHAKDMKEVMEMRKENIKTQQQLNKQRMELDMETKPLVSSVKDQIKIAREAKAKKAKQLKKDATFVGGATGAGGATIVGIKKYEDSKKEKERKK